MKKQYTSDWVFFLNQFPEKAKQEVVFDAIGRNPIPHFEMIFTVGGVKYEGFVNLKVMNYLLKNFQSYKNMPEYKFVEYKNEGTKKGNSN